MDADLLRYGSSSRRRRWPRERSRPLVLFWEKRGRVDCMIAWIIIDGTHSRAWDKDGTDNPRCYS